MFDLPSLRQILGPPHHLWADETLDGGPRLSLPSPSQAQGIVKGGDDIKGDAKRRDFFATLFTQMPSSSLVVCKFHPEGTARCSSLGTGLDSWLFHERCGAIKGQRFIANQPKTERQACKQRGDRLISVQEINNHQSTKVVMNTLWQVITVRA